MSPELLALLSAFAYAGCIISARRGLQYSTPTTVTYVSLLVHTITLWTAVFLTGGIPPVAPLALVLFLIGGSLQPMTRLLTYTGVEKLGASRSYTLRATTPLFSTIVAIAALKEEAGWAILLGTLLIVVGIMVVSWDTTAQPSSFRWWHLLIPLAAAFLAGIVHPIRRYALILSDEPLFFAAVVGAISLVWYMGYLALPSTRAPVWNPKAILPFLSAGLCETAGILLNIMALSHGTVVVVSPIIATSPLWVLIASVVFLRDIERLNARTILASFCVVAGTMAITLGR